MINKSIFLYSLKFLGILFVIFGINEIPVIIIILKDNFFSRNEIILQLQLVSQSIPYILFGSFLFFKTEVLFKMLVIRKSNITNSNDMEYSLVGVGVIMMGIYFTANALLVSQCFIGDIINISLLTLTNSVFYMKTITVVIPLLIVINWKNITDLILNDRASKI